MGTPSQDKAASLIAKESELCNDRKPHEPDWNDIVNLVRPVSGGYDAAAGRFVTQRTVMMYDGTAPDALEDLAGGLHSYLTNPTERWFTLEVENNADLNRDPEVLEWLDIVSDIIYQAYSDEDANFNPSLHEGYLDIGSFGTCVVFQEAATRGVRFFTFPIRDCTIAENSKGRVDTLYRKFYWSIRQCKQEFGDVLPGEMAGKRDDEIMEMMHCVFPRKDRNAKMLNKTNKAFASYWVCITCKEVCEESGFDSFPYAVARWTKLAGEKYGRSPAKKCLADIKMLNAMEKTVLKAANKLVDPPLVVDNEGVMTPLETHAGALIYKDPEANAPEPLVMGGNGLPFTEEKSAQKREYIRKSFYSDWLKMEKQNVEMTAYEVADRRDEKLRMIAPMLGRLVCELHGPLIQRTYSILNEQRMFPPAPVQMRGSLLKIGYQSPAARAQTGSKAVTMGRYLQQIIPLAQAHPEILDVIDWDGFAQETAIALGVPRKMLNTIHKIEEIRNQRAQQQQLSALAGMAEPVSKAMKNVADANQAGGLM